MTLLFHLTCETIITRRQATSPNSRPQVNTRSVHPHDHTRDANTYLASSRTYPSTSPTGDTRCWSTINSSVPSQTVTRSAVMPYLPVEVLAPKGPASTADHSRDPQQQRQYG